MGWVSRFWLMRCGLVLVWLCLLMPTGKAKAANVVIDFESALSTYSSTATFTITGGAAEFFQIITPPSGGWGIKGTVGNSHLGIWGTWTAAGKNGGWTGASDTTYGKISLLGGLTNVSLDVFSNGNQSISFYGFAGGVLQTTVTPSLALSNVNGTNEYLARTVTLNGVDEIRYNSSSPFGIDNLIVGVPEPSAVSLLAVGLGGLAMIRRRRKKD